MSGDIVERLRYAEEHKLCERQVLIDAADEIVRLRDAGDALAEVADEWPELVAVWQEARRGWRTPDGE